MPREFSGNVQTPTDLRFGADEFVDDGGHDLDKVAKSLGALNTAMETQAVRQYRDQEQVEVNNQEELYGQARKLKRGIYDSALAGDDAAISDYTNKLENLKIAERQGAISGTNGQIRKESLLRTYINRFPHLEDELRRSYSSVHAQARAEREQFKDPIEEGIDDAIKQATASGMDVGEYLNMQHRQKKIELDTKELELQAKMGTNVENQVDNMFTDVVHTEQMRVNNLMERTIRELSQQGVEFNAEKVAGDINNWKQQAMIEARRVLYGIRDRSDYPDGVMSREFVDSRVKQIGDLYDEKVKFAGSFDTLKEYTRAREIGKERNIASLSKYDPMLGFMLSMDPEKAGEIVFKDWYPNEQVYLNGGLSRYNVLIQQADTAGDTMTGVRMRFQKNLLNSWYGDGKAVAHDVKRAMEDGEPPEPTGYPEVDANKLNMITTSMLNSPNVKPEQKAKVASAALKAEKYWSGPGEYLAPSKLWYTDPARRNVLRANDPMRKEMTTNIENGTTDIVRQIDDPQIAAGMMFAPQMEEETKFTREPWRAYRNGGPWSSPHINKPQVARSTSMSAANPKTEQTIKALNDSYWIMRGMHGPQKAEEWAMQVQDLLGQAANPEEGDELGEEETPTFDLTD